MINKLLIANRGEIAVRVAQTCQQMGIRTVAVYADADRRSIHVGCADEAYPLEGRTAAETYLNGTRIIEIARRCGAQAIHPGYGFLSENGDFAQACADAGLTFVGPKPDVIRAMGDKLAAKKAFADAGVPVVPGWSGDERDVRAILAAAREIGYPVLVKAAAGGGGKGMRVVPKDTELESALDAARRESKAAFGDARVFIEKYIRHPRHVEIQIFGDQHGNVIHLFERECSIQRRHQKILEESPSPALTPELRGRMGEAAVRAARAIGYTNAGTVEFMVDGAGNFYFLEVNTRLQVEHPVTEMLVRHDLVQAQILVATGEPLPFTQDTLEPAGHAIEVRVYAEDPDRGFLPSTGVIERYVPPAGPNIRVDSGVTTGAEVTVYFDPMLAKLIVWDRTREAAANKLAWALDRFVLLGVTTNIPFLRALVDHPEFRAGRLHTQFLEEHSVRSSEAPMPDEGYVVAALAARGSGGQAAHDRSVVSNMGFDGPWQSGRAWRVI